MDLWVSLRQWQLQANTWSLNAALGALGWAAATQGLAENWRITDAVSFNVLLAALAEGMEGTGYRGWSASLSLLCLLRSGASQPDAASLGPSISACSRAGRWQEAVHVLKVCADIADMAACNAALAGRADAGQWQQAFCELEALFARAQQPDVVTFNSCFSACETARVGNRALELLQYMCTLDFRPSAISINTVVSACEKASQWQTALGLLAKLPCMGLLPDIVSYNAAMGACSENWHQACLLFQDMLSAQLHPDEVTLGALTASCANAQRLDLIDELLDAMHRRGDLARTQFHTSRVVELWVRAKFPLNL